MRYPDPGQLTQYAYYPTDNSPLHFRNAPPVPKTIRGKPVPHNDTHLFYGDWAAPMHMYVPFLNAVKVHPDVSMPVIPNSQWDTPELVLEALKIGTYNTARTALVNKNLRAARNDLIREYLVSHTMTETAELFGVTIYLVNKLKAGTLTPVAPRPTHVGPVRPLKTPRYRVLSKEVQKARAKANKYNLHNSFSITDVLHLSADRSMYYTPERCPVLRCVLNYNKTNTAASVRVWRGDVSKDLVSGNVYVMSSIAARMIENSRLDKDAVINGLTLDNLQAWHDWYKTHQTNWEKEE